MEFGGLASLVPYPTINANVEENVIFAFNNGLLSLLIDNQIIDGHARILTHLQVVSRQSATMGATTVLETFGRGDLIIDREFTGGRIPALWAVDGNTDPIPAAKLVNAPTGGGMGMGGMPAPAVPSEVMNEMVVGFIPNGTEVVMAEVPVERTISLAKIGIVDTFSDTNDIVDFDILSGTTPNVDDATSIMAVRGTVEATKGNVSTNAAFTGGNPTIAAGTFLFCQIRRFRGNVKAFHILVR